MTLFQLQIVGHLIFIENSISKAGTNHETMVVYFSHEQTPPFSAVSTCILTHHAPRFLSHNTHTGCIMPVKCRWQQFESYLCWYLYIYIAATFTAMFLNLSSLFSDSVVAYCCIMTLRLKNQAGAAIDIYVTAGDDSECRRQRHTQLGTPVFTVLMTYQLGSPGGDGGGGPRGGW